MKRKKSSLSISLCNFSESSVYKYAHAAETISKDMLAKDVIPIGLFEMSPIQIDVYMPVILSDPDFVKKNSTGNKMYSNALKRFRNFRIDVSENPVTAEEIQSAIPNSIIIWNTTAMWCL